MSKKVIKWSLVIIWMIVIFNFSSQVATVSDNKSLFVIELIKRMGIDLDSILGSIANFIVRKAAHMTEYFVLYLLLFNALYEKYSFKKNCIVSLIIVFLYACSDEFHQLFVQGREGRFRDVLIDTTGGGIGVLITYIVVTLQKNYLRKKKLLIK